MRQEQEEAVFAFGDLSALVDIAINEDAAKLPFNTDRLVVVYPAMSMIPLRQMQQSHVCVIADFDDKNESRFSLKAGMRPILC
ncbi:MAG: hypothetical protein ACLR13_00875 [Acutalibacteraceae bacterium]